MVTLLIISTVHVRSFPYLRPPLPDSSLDESLLFCASAFWTIPWKCLKPDGIVKGNKCEELSLFYSLFFPCFFVQFFSNWQHSIIATRKFCWYYAVCDWPMLANVIISFVSTERWCYTRKALNFPQHLWFKSPRKCWRRNGAISSAPSWRLGAAKEWLNDSRSPWRNPQW